MAVGGALLAFAGVGFEDPREIGVDHTGAEAARRQLFKIGDRAAALFAGSVGSPLLALPDIAVDRVQPVGGLPSRRGNPRLEGCGIEAGEPLPA
jgi:hypothetical protein